MEWAQAIATRSIGTTGYFRLHLDFLMEKPLRIEIDFMQQLQKGTGNPPNLAISSDVCKGIEKAVKAVFPWAEHRECFLHLKNFVKQFQGPEFGRK